MSNGQTPGPWKVGYWLGQCHKVHAGRIGHPGPGGEDGCVYEPVFYAGSGGIAGPEPNQMVVYTHYDELKISDSDAHLIAMAPDLWQALLDISAEMIPQGMSPALYAASVIRRLQSNG